MKIEEILFQDTNELTLEEINKLCAEIGTLIEESIGEDDINHIKAEISKLNIKFNVFNSLLEQANNNQKLSDFLLTYYKEDLFEIAISNINLEITKFILDRYADDINYCSSENQNTLLHAAVRRGEIPIVSYLLKQNEIDINCKNKFGKTPLHYAAKGRKEIVLLLIDNSKIIDINSQDNEGKSPLHHAFENPDNVNILLHRLNTNINIQDKKGNSPLHYAVEKNKETTKLFLEKSGIDINLQNIHGNTPLHYAVFAKQNKIIELLLAEEKIEANLQNNIGNTPLHHAMNKSLQFITPFFNHSEIYKSTVARNKNGKTPEELIDDSQWSKCIEYVKFLFKRCKRLEENYKKNEEIEFNNDDFLYLFNNDEFNNDDDCLLLGGG